MAYSGRLSEAQSKQFTQDNKRTDTRMRVALVLCLVRDRVLRCHPQTGGLHGLMQSHEETPHLVGLGLQIRETTQLAQSAAGSTSQRIIGSETICDTHKGNTQVDELWPGLVADRSRSFGMAVLRSVIVVQFWFCANWLHCVTHSFRLGPSQSSSMQLFRMDASRLSRSSTQCLVDHLLSSASEVIHAERMIAHTDA